MSSLPQRDSGRTKEDNNHERALHIQKLSPVRINQKKTALKSPIYCSIHPPASAGDAGLIPGSERSPEEENGNPLQYSCLEKPMDRGAWKAIVHGVTKEPDTTERLNNSNDTA